MIERVWSARTTRDGAVTYAEYFRRVVMPELAAVVGYRGARLMQREMPGGAATEVVVLTRWDSLAVVRGFAGDDIDRAWSTTKPRRYSPTTTGQCATSRSWCTIRAAAMVDVAP